MSMTGPLDEPNGDNATVRQQKIAQQPPREADNTESDSARRLEPVLASNRNAFVASMAERKGTDTGTEFQTTEGPNGLDSQQDELITVVHAPLSGDQWRSELQKAGRQLSQMANGKKANEKTEDVAQLVCAILQWMLWQE